MKVELTDISADYTWSVFVGGYSGLSFICWQLSTNLFLTHDGFLLASFTSIFPKMQTGTAHR